MNLKNQIVLDAQKHQGQQNLIDDYGNLMYILAYPINIGLGIIGGLFDAAIIYAIINKSFDQFYLAIAVALVLSALIQFLMGSPVMHITKNIYYGLFQNKKGFGKMLALLIICSATAILISLCLSWKTDHLVDVAVSPTYNKKLKNEEAVKQYYDQKEAQLLSTYTAEKEQLEKKVNDLKNSKDRVLDKRSGLMVRPWLSRKTQADIEQVHLPALTATYNENKAILKSERKNELQLLRNQNSKIQDKKESAIILGGTATKFGNVGINLFRVLIVIFYMIFILDAKVQAAEQSVNKVPEQQYFTQKMPAPTPRYFNQNQQPEQPQTLVTQSVQHNRTTEQLNNRTEREPEQPRTVVQGFQPSTTPNNRTEQPTEQPRTIVREQKTIVIRDTELTDKKRKAKQAFYRSHWPSLDPRYQKMTKSPSQKTLYDNKARWKQRTKELEEFGYYPVFGTDGKFKTIEYRLKSYLK